MIVDYWDAGYVQLDVTDPANPTLISDTDFAEEDPLFPGSGLTPEGNAHQGEFSFDNQFLLAADEDFAPVPRPWSERPTGRPPAARRGTESAATATRGSPPARRDDERAVGVRRRRLRRGRPIPARAGRRRRPDTEDIALIERGGRATSRVKFDNVRPQRLGRRDPVQPARGPTTATSEHAARASATIPACTIRAARRASAPTGVLSDLAPTTPAAGTAGPAIGPSARSSTAGATRTSTTRRRRAARRLRHPGGARRALRRRLRDLSIHEFATDPTEPLAYSSYYGGGIRVFQLQPRRRARADGRRIAPGGSNFWGVEQFTTPEGERLIAGSDRDFGL